MTYVSTKKLTAGGFYNIFSQDMRNGILHQERICSFYNWDDVEDFFKGKALLEGKKVIRQEFISGRTILCIRF